MNKESTKSIPKWILWAGIGVIGICLFIVILAALLGGFVILKANKGEEQDSEEIFYYLETPAKTVNTPTNTTLPSPTITITIFPTLTRTPTQTATIDPSLGIGSTFINEIDEAQMVYVPAGEFLMGSNAEDIDWVLTQKFCIYCGDDWFKDEKPMHTNNLDAFWIYKYEVSNEQFKAFVDDTGYQTDAEKKGYSYSFLDGGWSNFPANWSYTEAQAIGFEWLREDPVVHISWNDANAYCEWAGGRLPTEAEWEMAARGTEGSLFPWGDNEPTGTQANFCDGDHEMIRWCSGKEDGFWRYATTGSYPDGASPFDVLDMAGNVFEWVADWYSNDYYERSSNTNPSGPLAGSERVLRGGSWDSDPWALRTSYRSKNSPDFSASTIGFRCVQSP